MTDQEPTQPFEVPEAPPPAPPAPVAAVAPEQPVAPPAPPVAPPTAWATQDLPEPAPVPTQPVVAEAPARRSGGGRARWIVAALVALLVLGGGGVAAFLLTSSPATSSLAGWAPADTVTYGEVRLDMPGGQGAELGKFLAPFPGFADQAALPAKLSEMADRLIGDATDGKHNYSTEIKPWLAGEIAVAQGPAPASISTSDPVAALQDVHMLVLVAVTDAEKASAWAESVVTETGATPTRDTYNGVTIVTVELPDVEVLATSLPKLAYAVNGKVMLVGDLASLKAALDTRGSTGLAASKEYAAARAALPGANLGFMFASSAGLVAQLESLGDSMGDATVGKGIASVYAKLLPPWSAAAEYARDGRLVIETAQPHVDALGAPDNHADAIAAMAPADTVLLVSGHGVGARMLLVKAMFDAEPSLKDALGQLDDALGVVGGFEAAVGWMGDTGLVLTKQGEGVDGGLVVAPGDAASAERLFTSLRSLITLGAQGMLEFKEETYNGTTIVSVDLSSLGAMAGSMTGTDAVPADLTLAYALADDVVVIGIGPQFVKDVLDARGGDNLAAQPRYSTLIAAAGGKENAGVLWVDVAAARGLIEPLLPSDVSATYEKEIKPYLEPLDAMAGVTIAAKDVDRSRILLTSTK